jgi:putative polyketide hydroxylase
MSTRVMELMRRFGLEEAVRAGAADVDPTALVTPTLSSTEGMVMPLGYPTDEEAARVSPSRPSWTPQAHHEPLLLAHLQASPTATVRFGIQLVALDQGGHGVRATLLDRESGQQRQIDTRYLIAADGAHSTARTALGIAMEGPDDLAVYERVEFRAALDRAVGQRRHALYVLKHPAVDGAVLARRGPQDRWGLSRERPAVAPGMDELTDDDLIAMIRLATGVEDLDVAIERVSSFTFAAQIAQRYRNGRSFLIGDASHRMTPRGGTGMNTGIQDSFDVGWKLAWVLRGWAPERLLDTYERERRPIGLHNVGRAAEVGGARRTSDEALPWDLDDRLTHHWVDHDGRRVSTLDLIGDGLTLFAAIADPRWAGGTGPTGFTAPIDVVALPAGAATALGLGSTGAVLVRPDGHEVARWSAPGSPPEPGAAWLADAPSP